jgi:hypothetical protein
MTLGTQGEASWHFVHQEQVIPVYPRSCLTHSLHVFIALPCLHCPALVQTIFGEPVISHPWNLSMPFWPPVSQKVGNARWHIACMSFLLYPAMSVLRCRQIRLQHLLTNLHYKYMTVMHHVMDVMYRTRFHDIWQSPSLAAICHRSVQAALSQELVLQYSGISPIQIPARLILLNFTPVST